MAPPTSRERRETAAPPRRPRGGGHEAIRRGGLLFLLTLPLPALAAPPTTLPEVVARHPHDPAAFTQGLAWADGWLYESTGLYGASSLRRYRPGERGGTLRALSPRLFGEGLVVVGDRLIQLTWRAGLALVWRRNDLTLQGRFGYRGEGWGLAYDGRRLYHSDGSATITLRDPVTFRERGRLEVHIDGKPLARLNELEWVEGELWANVFESPRIARIDPRSGRVLGWIDLGALRPPETRTDRLAVANGIAYAPETRRLFVTGKRWPVLYELALPAKRPSHSANQDASPSAANGGEMK